MCGTTALFRTGKNFTQFVRSLHSYQNEVTNSFWEECLALVPLANAIVKLVVVIAKPRATKPWV
jgi:hypothetical protein